MTGGGSFRVSAADLPAILAKQAKDLPRIASLGLRVGVEKGRAKVVRRTPVGLPPGSMRQAWSVFPWKALGWRLDNRAPHAGIVEAGARPHPVSAEGEAAIREWVARKLKIVPTKTGKMRKATRKEVERGAGPGGTAKTAAIAATIDKITRAIVWKLRRFGQKPTWVVRDILPELAKIAQDEAGKAIGAYLAEPPTKA